MTLAEEQQALASNTNYELIQSVMHECPYCRRQAITTWRRYRLSPAKPTSCMHCGRKIGVSYERTVLGASPFIASLIVAHYIEPVSFAVVVALIGLLAALALWSRLVPLEKRP